MRLYFEKSRKHVFFGLVLDTHKKKKKTKRIKKKKMRFHGEENNITEKKPLLSNGMTTTVLKLSPFPKSFLLIFEVIMLQLAPQATDSLTEVISSYTWPPK